MRYELLARWAVVAASIGMLSQGSAASNVYLTEVPDYDWWLGCFGTASGNLMGYWDRHGFPDFYTGPTNGGLAPLNSGGPYHGIVSLWASQAGIDGRPDSQYGHYDDYYVGYESVEPDPYVIAGRPEHAPDCIGDFIGLSQWKWANMAGECNGNVDGYCFNYWDASGAKRMNYTPGDEAGLPARDIQSGLRTWARSRGSEGDAFSQLVDFNLNTPYGTGFTYEDLKAEINAGYPVLLFLQNYDSYSRTLTARAQVNPSLHGMLAYGYYETDSGGQYVRYRTSWASGDNRLHAWNSEPWEAALCVRGVIGFHPTPKIRHFELANGNLTIHWEGPASELLDPTLGVRTQVHRYIVEAGDRLQTSALLPVSETISGNQWTYTNCPNPVFLRVKLIGPQ